MTKQLKSYRLPDSDRHSSVVQYTATSKSQCQQQTKRAVSTADNIAVSNSRQKSSANCRPRAVPSAGKRAQPTASEESKKQLIRYLEVHQESDHQESEVRNDRDEAE